MNEHPDQILSTGLDLKVFFGLRATEILNMVLKSAWHAENMNAVCLGYEVYEDKTES